MTNTSPIAQSAWAFFLRNIRVTLIIIIGIITLGLYNLSQIPQEVNPEVNIPTALITTPYPGASPVDIEELITIPIEQKIATIDDIEDISSTSMEGMSTVIINFRPSSSMDTNMDNLQSALDSLTDLPSDVDTPRAQELTLSDSPIITFSFFGPYNEDELKQYGERIEATLKSIPGISEVLTSGIRDKEFHIAAHPQLLEQYNITFGEVLQLLQTESINTPVGNLTIDNTRYPIRLAGSLKTVADLQNLPIRVSNTGGILYLRDIATVSESFSRETARARVSSEGNPSAPSVNLALFKKPGGNTINIIDTAKSTVEELYTTGDLPESLGFETINDSSEFIREDIKTLVTSGLQTVLLIAILLFLALGFKEALIASLSIPLVFCIAFIGLNQLGFSINGMTLFALILSLGLLVDTSIIVLEGFHEYHIVQRKNSYEAALMAIHTYRAPLISGTATTIAAFIPMLLVGGILGEFLKAIPWTIIVTLSGSLFVALAICTALCYIAFRNTKPQEQRTPHKPTLLTRGFTVLRNIYTRSLAIILKRALLRWGILLAALGLFAFTLSLPITGVLTIQLFPAINVNYFSVAVEAPEGSTLEYTDTVVQEVETLLQNHPMIRSYVVTVGGGVAGRDSALSSAGAGGSTHLAGFSINLIDKNQREVTSSEIIEEFRDQFSTITRARVSITEAQAGPPTGAPVEIRITGPNLTELTHLTEDIESLLRTIPGTVEVENDIQRGTGEFLLSLDREELRQRGVRSSDLTTTLRAAIFGITAGTIQKDGTTQDIILGYTDPNSSITDAKNADFLQTLTIPTISGNRIPLSNLVTITLGSTYTGINRFEEERILRVKAQTDGTPVNTIVTAMEAALTTITIPEGYTVQFGGENEATQESFQDLFMSMIIAVFLIAFILILQFNSYAQPFIIIFTVPLALIGVLGGLTLFDMTLSFPAFIGVVSLSGIVVNDAIVLIDRINYNRREQLALLDSIIEATIARMQPIFLTSTTTIIGLLPLSFSDPVWGGLGFSIIFGLSVATILILLIVPILYYMMEKRGARKRGELLDGGTYLTPILQ